MSTDRWERNGSALGVDRETITQAPPGWSRHGDHPHPLLFLHGICSGAWAFEETWLPAAAERGYHATALSFRGHGDSSGYERLKVTTVRDYALDTMQVITTLPAPPVIIAHSMGALAAREVAARYPAVGLVLVAPAPSHGAWRSGWKQLRDSPLDLAKSVVTSRTPERPELLFSGLTQAEAMGLIRRMGPESPMVMTSLLRPRRFEDPLCETVVFGAENDQLIGPRDVEHTARELGVEVQWLPDAGHEVMLDRYAARSIGQVLDTVDDRFGADRAALAGQVWR